MFDIIVIIGMPPHIIMHGIPLAIMDIIMFMRSFIISICDMSIGIILQIMPSLVISQVILQVIGIMFMPMPIIGFIMPIIGFIPIIGIIIGIGMFMPIIGFIMPIIGFIPIIGIMPMCGIGIGIGWFIIGIGIVFIMMTASYAPDRIAQVRARWMPAPERFSSARADARLDPRKILRRFAHDVRRDGCSYAV